MEYMRTIQDEDESMTMLRMMAIMVMTERDRERYDRVARYISENAHDFLPAYLTGNGWSVFDEEWLDATFDSPAEAARAVYFGDVASWGDEYAKLDGAMNVETVKEAYILADIRRDGYEVLEALDIAYDWYAIINPPFYWGRVSGMLEDAGVDRDVLDIMAGELGYGEDD